MGKQKIKKDITFIYWDKAEKNLLMPIAEEAKRRGYATKLTNNKFEKCEIGIYCQHVNFPEFSKFSVIMLHDIIQRYSSWPDLWYWEPWNKYHIGILPSKQWVSNWEQCSQWYYSRPKIGMFEIGWPKADVITLLQEESSKKLFFEKYHMNLSKPTVLYAPAWENDNKEDDFVKAMLKLDVNILIKQAHFPEEDYPDICRNIEEMRLLHQDIDNVTILPPETNIFDAIAVSEILVSEESSTMCEAAMMGIPAVSVSNWLVPDVTPSRYPKCDYDFVELTTKEKLTDCVKGILDNYDYYHEKTKNFANRNFSNVGRTSSMILDIIDDCVNGNKIRYSSLKPNDKKTLSPKKYLKHVLNIFKSYVVYNYRKRYFLVRFLINIYAWLLNKEIG